MNFFTVGTRTIYDEGLNRLNNQWMKLGKTLDYQGGIVFTSLDCAKQYCNDHPKGEYAVYGLSCRIEDTYLHEDGNRYLLTTSRIYSLDESKEGGPKFVS